MKLVINRCFGGFGLSPAAVLRGRAISGDPKWGPVLPGETYDDGSVSPPSRLLDKHQPYREANRSDPTLVAVVEEMGAAASGELAKLVVIEIPDGVEYDIDDYDGMESVHEQHRSWP